jgi:hypothetical protein
MNYGTASFLYIYNMKRNIINVVLVLFCSSITNIFCSFLIHKFFIPEFRVFSINTLMLCMVFPIILLFFKKEIKTKKIVLISILYSFIFTLISVYI